MNKKMIVSHPGVYLSDAIDALEITEAEFAIKAGLDLETLKAIIEGKSAISPEIASKLSAFFGTSIDLWLNLQAAYNNYLQSLN